MSFNTQFLEQRAAASPLQDRIAAALLAIFVLVWLAPLGGHVLISPDEGRYATISLEMLRSGDWITPRLNGLLYFEKPPLQYWAGAASLALFGHNEFAVRLWPGLSGLAMVFLVGYTAARLWSRRAGAIGLVVAGSTTWIIGNAHFLSLDAGLAGTLTLVLCALLLAERPGLAPDLRRRWIWAAWAGMGLAVLSKGLVGILIPGAVLVLHSLWRRDFSPWRRLHWMSGLAILLALTAPWFVLVSLRNPDFAWFFFVREHFLRYLTTQHHRTGAWWYFVPPLLGGFMPWTGSLPWILRAPRADFARSLLVVWAVFVFVFFSASGSKLPSYILPMFPALALLLAYTLDRVADSAAAVRKLRWHLLVPGAVCVALVVAATQAGRFTPHDAPPGAVGALATAVAAGALAFLLASVAAWRWLARGRLLAALALVAGVHLAAVLGAMLAHDQYRALRSASAIAAAIEPTVGADAPVFAVGGYDQTLPFYLGRPVVLVAYRDEFEFGEDHEPERWIPTIDAFVARWQREPRAAAYLGRAQYDALHETLQAQGSATRVVYADARRVVVVKAPLEPGHAPEKVQP